MVFAKFPLGGHEKIRFGDLGVAAKVEEHEHGGEQEGRRGGQLVELPEVPQNSSHFAEKNS